MPNVVEQIASKSASLPAELQHEILDFVEFVSVKRDRNKSGRAFESVRGLIGRELNGLDEDIVDVRREMWGNFPREASE